MRSSWIPVLNIRQNIFQCLCLALLVAPTLFVENAAEPLSVSHNRQQFPKQNSTKQNHQDNRNQFPTQRRGSGTY